MEKLTVEETAIIFKLFEDVRICPLRKDSDKYCAAVLSIVRKLGSLTEIPNEETRISRNNDPGDPDAAAELDKVADKAAGDGEGNTADGLSGPVEN